MNVTSWLLRVKQARVELVVAFSVSALLLGSATAINVTNRDDKHEHEQLGAGLAAGLAKLVVEPLVERDHMRLGVLANRLVELDSVQGVTVITVDNELLTLSGNNLRGEPSIQPVVQDKTILGYVRVYLVDPSALNADSRRTRALLGLLAALVIPLAVVGLSQVNWPDLRTHRQRRGELPVAAPASEVPHYLVALNLFNQFNLDHEVRERELSLAADLADRVAGLYYARVTHFPGTGLLLDFDHTADPDRAFGVVCAAFLLSRLIRNANSPGEFRLGLHCTLEPPGAAIDLKAGAAADTALLSALARNQSLALSNTFYREIARPERMVATPLDNPLLKQLESTPAQAWLALHLVSAQEDLLDQQAGKLDYALDSTTRESAF